MHGDTYNVKHRRLGCLQVSTWKSHVKNIKPLAQAAGAWKPETLILLPEYAERFVFEGVSLFYFTYSILIMKAPTLDP